MKPFSFHVQACTFVLLGGLCLTTLASAREGAVGGKARSADAAALVERGRYLVKITGCNDCHTPRYKEEAGKIAETAWLVGDDSFGWQGPWGTTYPVNLRLHMQKLTLPEWLASARRPMRPPMPWFSLRDMTDEDLKAIYSYIRSLGPAGSPTRSYVPPGQPAPTPVVRLPAT